MKKIMFIVMSLFIFAEHAFATTGQELKNNDVAKAYQEGLQAGNVGLKNQKMWAKGEGDPKMAKAYQEGLSVAAESVKNEQVSRK